MPKTRIFEYLIGKLLSGKYSEAVMGDLQEIYEARAADGRFRARIWLVSQLLASLYSLCKQNIRGGAALFKNYLLMALRNLNKHRAYALINIFGLALGLSAAILILLYLQFEISFDRFHENADSLYRVSVRHIKEGKLEGDTHVFTPPMGADMKKDMPEVEGFVRMSTRRPMYFTVENKAFKEEYVCYASSQLFKMFSFRLTEGDPDMVLEDPFSIVLTEEAARRIFGSEEALGKTIQIGPENLYRVTGIAESPPGNSTIQFSALISFVTLYSLPNMYLDWNGGNQYITYVKLRNSATQASVEAKFPDFMWRYINETLAPYGWLNEAYLQPLKKIHFHFDASSKTALANFYTFAAVALFILIIACINFINLTTARASRRAREVGMRKVIGATRGNLIRQFLGESVLLTSLAFITGIALAYVLTPTYNQLLNKDLNPLQLVNLVSIGFLFCLILLVGFSAGVYPAFYLSSFQPVKTLKGVLYSGKGKQKFRNGLVVFQFVISVTLIICTFLIRDQLRFIKQFDLGYNKENMLIVPLPEKDMRTKTEEMRAEMLGIPGITQAAASSAVPYRGFTSNGYIPEGYTHSIMIHALDIDEHFLDTFEIEVVKGRNFSKDFATDDRALLINETLAEQLGWEEPVGKTIARNGEWHIIGVVEDFQFDTLHDTVAPLLITNNPWGTRFYHLSLRVKSGNLPATLASVEKIFKKHSPLISFEYFFLDDAFDTLYKSEERFERIFLYFSLLAIAVALLGLFSLSAYTAQQKAKEIGIRKVLGATVPNILTLFSREMVILIVAANLLAAPIAAYVIHLWLGNFAYRMNMGIGAFLIAFSASLVAAFATISYQSLKAAFKKPVDELRSE
jgi:putative ABC transport system permease protein